MVANHHDPSKEASMIDHSHDTVVAQLKQEIQRLTAKQQQAAQTHEQQIYAAELTIAAREKELDQLYKHVHELTTENETQSGALQDRAALDDARRELDAAQKYAASVSSSLHHTQQKLKTTENAIATLRPQLDAANSHLKSLQSENTRLRGQLLSADDAIMQLRPQVDAARAEASRLADELSLVRSSKAAGLVPLQNQLQEAEAHIGKLDAELVTVDRERFEFESECVRLREALRFTGGLGPQLARETERRQAAQHDLVKLDKFCRHLRDQLTAVQQQTGKAMLPGHFPPPPPHPYGPSTSEMPAPSPLDRMR